MQSDRIHNKWIWQRIYFIIYTIYTTTKNSAIISARFILSFSLTKQPIYAYNNVRAPDKSLVSLYLTKSSCGQVIRKIEVLSLCMITYLDPWTVKVLQTQHATCTYYRIRYYSSTYIKAHNTCFEVLLWILLRSTWPKRCRVLDILNAIEFSDHEW